MNSRNHFNILDYTIMSLLRRKSKNAGIITVFAFVIFIAGSVLLMSDSYKREAGLILKHAPEIIVQKMTAGRHELIPAGLAEDFLKIPGVSKAEPRYWGYYYDPVVKANYTVVSSPDPETIRSKLLKGSFPAFGEQGKAAIGRGISDTRLVGLEGTMTLFTSGGNEIDFEISGIFEAESDILTADLIVINQDDLVKLFDIPDGEATDIVVSVHNETEIPVIARKIRGRFPFTRPIIRDEIIRTYDAVFGWRSGFILTVFSGALAAFIILAWDKATGLSAEEKKEIGILKAIGWETSAVLEMKFWEGTVISLTSFLLGIILSYIHIFFFGAALFAPVLKGWSVITPEIRLAPFINPYHVSALACLTIIPYVASTIIPSWKASITDPDEVMRG